MNNYQSGGIIVGIILAAVASMKMELVKEIARKITSGKEKTTAVSYVILFALFAIPTALGYAIPNNEAPENNDPQNHIVSEDTSHSQIKDIAEVGEKAVVLSKEIADEAIEAKKKRQEDFQANRIQRWVYQIGERINAKNNDDLYNLYSQVKSIDNLYFFKIDGDLLIFRNEDHSKEDLEKSLEDFKAQINNVTRVQIVDLMSFCTRRKPSISDHDRWAFGKKKNKTVLPCLVCK